MLLRKQFLLTFLVYVLLPTCLPLQAQDIQIGMKEESSRYEHFYENIEVYTEPVSQEKTPSGLMAHIHQYRFELFPGGNLADIQFSFSYEGQFELLANGNLKVIGPNEEMIYALPRSYQVSPDGEMREVPIVYQHTEKGVVLVADSYEMAQVLYIDMKIIQQLNPSAQSAISTPALENMTNFSSLDNLD